MQKYKASAIALENAILKVFSNVKNVIKKDKEYTVTTKDFEAKIYIQKSNITPIIDKRVKIIYTKAFINDKRLEALVKDSIPDYRFLYILYQKGFTVRGIKNFYK